MDSSFLQELSDGCIEERLFHADCLEPLEALIQYDQQRLSQLSKQPDFDNLGQRVDEPLSVSLMENVRDEVDRILGVQALPAPSLSGSRFFSAANTATLAYLGGGVACFGAAAALVGRGVGRLGVERREGMPGRKLCRRQLLGGLALLLPGGALVGRAVLAERMRRGDAGYVWDAECIDFPMGQRRVPTELLLAHEYVHHVQKQLQFHSQSGVSLIVAMEGMARGVERLWAENRAKHGSPAYQHYQIAYRQRELPHVYVALCNQLGRQPKSELLGNLSATALAAARPDRRYFGYALFRIWEQISGPRLYRGLLHGNRASIRESVSRITLRLAKR